VAWFVKKNVPSLQEFQPIGFDRFEKKNMKNLCGLWPFTANLAVQWFSVKSFTMSNAEIYKRILWSGVVAGQNGYLLVL
jgi:hypothetical protein